MIVRLKTSNLYEIIAWGGGGNFQNNRTLHNLTTRLVIEDYLFKTQVSNTESSCT